ncbi:MAG: PEP/pyruvate-binding domain-containing protein [Thermodesulfobacteriota bacterium]
MDSRQLIRQISQKEPLNPYQIAGMAAVLDHSQVVFDDHTVLEVEALNTVLMVLDRTGEDASVYLIDFRQSDSHVMLFPRFPRERLDVLLSLTSLEGRRQAIAENLLPVLYEIPNWLDLVRTLSRYVLERDDEALRGQLTDVMEIIVSYLFAAIRQPFDQDARLEAEYALARLVESILKSASEEALPQYMPFVERSLDFLLRQVLIHPVNPLERRILEIAGIRAALKKRSDDVRLRVAPSLDKLMAQALITTLSTLAAIPSDLADDLRREASSADFPGRDRFEKEILQPISGRGPEEIERRRLNLEAIVAEAPGADPEELSTGLAFVKSLDDEWRGILSAFEDMVEAVPSQLQIAFAKILVVQILSIDKPEIKQLLVDGLCRIVLRLEKTRKQASRDLVNLFATLFLDSAYSSQEIPRVVSCLKAVESLGVTLGRHGYFLMAEELIDRLVSRPLIQPQEKRYTVEDDDTGEPLVLAEDAAASQAHVQHIKSLIAIIASNPRVMHRLIPYLIIQMEFAGARLCDEDLIQYWISSLLRANASVTHFLIRTLIKAIPYSFKDIGPLDTLRLTAAGLAKELANRGVRPIGNFLGKLRGDIHWRGSVENFYFTQGILKYLATGEPEAISEWMPRESMPYLSMDQWCSPQEAEGIGNLSRQIFEDYKLSAEEKNGFAGLIRVDTARYRENEEWPEFSRRVVLDVLDLLKGLHAKYFIARQDLSGTTIDQDLLRFGRIIDERAHIKETYLTPDITEAMPAAVTLTDGAEDYVREMERISRDHPGTPIVLRAKKAGHAYAQKATYIEEHFEAFNKDLTLESLQETIASSISNTHFAEITVENLPSALVFLDSLVRGLAVNGHSSYYLLQAGRDLAQAGALGMTFDKVRDLLRVIKRELDDIYAFYRQVFEPPFDGFVSSCPMDRLPRKLKNLTTLKEIPDSDFFRNYLKTLYISDLQARDGNLRVLETFVDKVELFLNQRLAESSRPVAPLPDTAGPKVPFYFPDHGDISPCTIGLKAALLRFAEVTPPYFVITTDLPLPQEEALAADSDFRAELSESVRKLEKLCGRSFGDPANPALFSVRSGSRLSLPGMMLTITNVGINDEIAATLAQQVDPWFAYDCYRRFLQEFGQSVYGVGREEFQDIIDERKMRWRVMRKAEMNFDQMKQLAFDYKNRLGALAPEAVKLIDSGQFIDILILCAREVLHSYDGPAARKFRQAADIHGNWRTPVIIQAMVYGNVDFETSGTGVVSYNPFSLELTGVFSRRDQGTDVVDGKVNTIPVYDMWKREDTLASLMPGCWDQLSPKLRRIAEELHMHINVEYTIEKSKAYILQIRKNRERRERLPSLRDSRYQVIAQGTGVSGKIFRGILVTDRNQIAPFRHINKAQSIVDAMNDQLPEGEKLDGFIFVVNDPIPEEIMEEVFSLPVSTALVSRLGGRGAHAADVAKSLRKVYVGQVRQIEKFAGKPESVRFGDLTLVVGSKLIIHGQTGEVALYGRGKESQSV